MTQDTNDSEQTGSAARHEAGHDDDHHGHSRWSAHHFDTPDQQLASAKLGMWIFLVTEILFFAGFFVAYAVYRRNHPEVFMDGHLLLDTSWGAINTVVLIFSSLTMALAVRAAQCSQQRALAGLLAITILCAFGFLGIKYVEYKGKWDHHLVPGQARIQYFFSSQFFEDLFSKDGLQPPDRGIEPDLHYIEQKLSHAGHGGGHGGGHGELDAGHDEQGGDHAVEDGDHDAAGDGHATEQADHDSAGGDRTEEDSATDKDGEDHAGEAPDHKATGGDHATDGEGHEEGGEAHAEATEEHGEKKGMSEAELERRATNMRTFLRIYFGMTGLHGLHVIIGIGVLTWILIRSLRGHFSSEYFEPVECTGLYWHLVDLIWIYLFPLMYLIH